MPDITIKRSRINGIGVFANRDFKKGEIILIWDTSVPLTKEQVEKLAKDEQKYVSHFGDQYILHQPPERYINHSCDSNSFVVNSCDVAKRDIKKGEEVTTDYAQEGAPNLYLECVCGSSNCRKIIKNK